MSDVLPLSQPAHTPDPTLPTQYSICKKRSHPLPGLFIDHLAFIHHIRAHI